MLATIQLVPERVSTGANLGSS